MFAGQQVHAGSIICRQRGTRFHPGEGAGRGGDDTIFATVSGTVQFGERRGKRIISVLVADRDGGGRDGVGRAAGERRPAGVL